MKEFVQLYALRPAETPTQSCVQWHTKCGRNRNVLSSSYVGSFYVWPIRPDEVFVEINIEAAGKGTTLESYVEYYFRNPLTFEWNLLAVYSGLILMATDCSEKYLNLHQTKRRLTQTSSLKFHFVQFFCRQYQIFL